MGIRLGEIFVAKLGFTGFALAGERDCEAVQLLFQMRARSDGMPVSKVDDLSWELRNKIWRLAWDEVVRVRKERLKAMGTIR